MDSLDLLAVQGTLQSLLQHHSSKASILQHSAFFMVQLSHPYMTTGNTIALTRWTFVVNVSTFFFFEFENCNLLMKVKLLSSDSLRYPIDTRLPHPWDFLGRGTGVSCRFLSLLFNMLSRLVMTFLPRSKSLLI